MRSLAIAAALSTLLSAGSASGQTIRIYADSTCGSCNVQVPFPGGTVFYTVLHPGSAQAASSVVFRVTGLPSGWTTITQRLHATAFDVIDGDPFGAGVAYSFPCRTGECIPLFRTLVLPSTAVSDVTLSVTHHALDCGRPFPWDCFPPRVFLCEEGLAAISEDAAGVINGDRECTVSVRSVTWGEARSLYR